MKRLAFALLLLVAVLAPEGTAHAQYSFAVPGVTMECFIAKDASVRIVYRIEFFNHGQTIDVVDVGLPHARYDIGNMRASLDGKPQTHIAPSSYIDVGVEVQLVGGIPPGSPGTFEFEATLPDLVFNDTTDDALASFQITPTWFDSNLLVGPTDLSIAIHLPPGVHGEDVRYQDVPFDRVADTADHAIVGFQMNGVRFDGPHRVGVSFPRAAMDRVVEVSRLELLEIWWEQSPGVRFAIGASLAVVFILVFLRFTGHTGFTVLFLTLGGGGLLFFLSPRTELYGAPLLFALFGWMEWRVRKRRRTYLPPITSVEGGGIRRGLTAPEAAVVLELPLGKVTTLVIFGLLKKGLLTQEAADPLVVALATGVPRSDWKARRRYASKKGVAIHRYEQRFLDVLEKHRSEIAQADFSGALQELVENVVERMTGYDLEETRAYYRSIVARAWVEAENLGEIEARTAAVDKNLEWLLMDEGLERRFDGWGSGGYVYVPGWIRLGGGGGGVPLPSSSTPAGGTSARPAFGDVAASFAGWTERVTSNVASGILPGAVRADGGQGIIDLSGVDKVTGEFFEALAESGGSGGGGGGGGGGCACACAGCACACACAGGGR